MGRHKASVGKATVSTWQLASGHYVPAKMQPVIIHPRPDSETNAWERHRMAPDGIEWRIPIVVQGGAWPFYFTVDATSAGKGITIGETYGSTDYGVLSWASPTIGTHTITVTVYTQEYGRNTSGMSDSLSVTFTLTVADKEDTSKFIWLDAVSGDDLEGGSYTTPKQTLASVQGAAHISKQLFLGDGAYTTDSALGQFTLGVNTSGRGMPPVMVGIPGASVAINFTQRSFTLNASGCHVANVSGEDVGYGATQPNPKYFSVAGGTADRITFFGIQMLNPQQGTARTDNPTIFWLPYVNPKRKYIAIHTCSETGRTGTAGNEGMLFIAYSADYMVAENCTADGVGYAGPNFKAANQNCTMRCVYCNGARSGRWSLGTGGQVEADLTASGNIEISWCRGTKVHLNYQDGAPTVSHWVYRTTLFPAGSLQPSIIVYTGRSAPGPFEASNNVLETSAATPIGSGITSVDNLTASSGLVDASGNLEAAYASYRGTHGYEVA